MDENKIFVREIIPVRRKLEALGIPLKELALRYLFAKAGNKSVLTGVETVEQLRENLQIAQMPPLADDILAEIDALIEAADTVAELEAIEVESAETLASAKTSIAIFRQSQYSF